MPSILKMQIDAVDDSDDDSDDGNNGDFEDLRVGGCSSA